MRSHRQEVAFAVLAFVAGCTTSEAVIGQGGSHGAGTGGAIGSGGNAPGTGGKGGSAPASTGGNGANAGGGGGGNAGSSAIGGSSANGGSGASGGSAVAGRSGSPGGAPGAGTGGGVGGSGAGMGGAGGADPCAGVPACEKTCPAGMGNPTDENRCVHSCDCAPLSWFQTCGAPVCQGYQGPFSGVPLCTSTEIVGSGCDAQNTKCDPMSGCDALYQCATENPIGMFGCPKSRKSYKRDIHYLDDAEVARFANELNELKLATWRYKQDPARERLGFMIDDHERSVAVDLPSDMVDLYGYTSLAVAGLQAQAREIAALKEEVALLRRDLKRGSGAARGTPHGR